MDVSFQLVLINCLLHLLAKHYVDKFLLIS